MIRFRKVVMQASHGWISRLRGKFNGLSNLSIPTCTGLLLVSLLLSNCQSTSAPINKPESASPLPTSNGISYPVPAMPPEALEAELSVTRQPPVNVPPAATPTPPPGYVYLTQAGDTLPALALRFQIDPQMIQSDIPLPEKGLLRAGERLYLPVAALGGEPHQPLLPDSELVYSPTASFFEVGEYLQRAGGYLANYSEYNQGIGWLSAAAIIERVGRNYSINPRLLLALLEDECGCVLGALKDDVEPGYLLGIPGDGYQGLVRQVEWAAGILSRGYYGWRSGALTEFPSASGRTTRPFPALNAGSVALAYYFASKNMITGGSAFNWRRALDTRGGLPALYTRMFGDPWERARTVEPLLPNGLAQPPLQLPFEVGAVWSFSSGPHPAWGMTGALAALDFAPAAPISGCVKSDTWVVAVADGLVVRSEAGVVVQELRLEGVENSLDGLEETGWAILYLHIESRQRVPKGTYVRAGERIGHPSCEGGFATGTHVHLARKYNGEWMPADGPLPFVLSGWAAHAGAAEYQGTLTRGGQTVVARPNGSRDTLITLQDDNG